MASTSKIQTTVASSDLDLAENIPSTSKNGIYASKSDVKLPEIEASTSKMSSSRNSIESGLITGEYREDYRDESFSLRFESTISSGSSISLFDNSELALIKDIIPYTGYQYYILLGANTLALRKMLTEAYKKSLQRKRFYPDVSHDSDDSYSSLDGSNIKKIQHEQLSITVNEKFKPLPWCGKVCQICYEFKALTDRPCCDFIACNECLSTYVASQVTECSDKIVIECINCKKIMPTTEVALRLKYSTFNDANELFLKRIKEASLKPGQYLCPNCGTCLEAMKSKFIPKSKKQESLPYENECHFCSFTTCSRCRSPWHEGLTCKQYKEGERSMIAWARGVSESRMATKCPGCKRWFQKIDGCDHMTCNMCKTQFYYSCGCRCYETMSDFLGSHSNKLSVLGCRENFLKKRPVIRKTIRGGLLAGVVTVAAPVVVPIGAVVGSGFLVGYAGFRAGKKIRKVVRNRRKERKRNEAPRTVCEETYPDIADDSDISFSGDYLEPEARYFSSAEIDEETDQKSYNLSISTSF